MEALLYDLRYAVRQMLRQPVFATVAIVTLAIGIGANTAVFNVVNAVLIAPLPLGDPDRLVWLGARAESGFDISVSIPNYYDWEARNTTFDAMGAARSSPIQVLSIYETPARSSTSLRRPSWTKS